MKNSPEFLRFCIIGVIGFGVDVAVLYAMAGFLGWYGARALSFIAAATATWWCNRRFTFQATHKTTPILLQYLRYMASMLLGAALNYAVYAATLHWTDMPGKAALGVALGSCSGLAVNFLLARHLVFKRHAQR
nr:GtrA family protein [uncultured Albidiferax sp.]